MIELPLHISNSVHLSAENKAMLSNVEQVPTVDPSYEDDRLKNIFQYYSLSPDEMDIEVHKHAAALLAQGNVSGAWQVLLVSG